MEKITASSVYFEAEQATAPIEQVVRLLSLVYDTYSLGNNELDEIKRANLLMNYDTIGEMLILAMNTLRQVQTEFKEIKIKEDSDPEPTASAN